MISKPEQKKAVRLAQFDELLRHRASLILREIITNNDDGNKKITVIGNSIYIGSSKQSVRAENQDKVACVHIYNNEKKESIIAVIIADGMGGLSKGSLVASESIAFFVSYLSLACVLSNPIQCVEEAILFSNEHIFNNYKHRSGTTFAAIVFFKEKTIAANVGDSRIYKYNNGTIDQISIDDSFSNVFQSDIEKLNENEFFDNLDNRLVQFIGVGKGIRPHIFEISKKSNDDKFILTTDGIHYLKNTLIEKILQNAPSDEEVIKRSISLAEWFGGHDNATMALVSENVVFKDFDNFYGDILIEIATNSKKTSIVFDSTPLCKENTKISYTLPKKTTKKSNKKKQDYNGIANSNNIDANLLFEFDDDRGKNNE